MENLIKALNIFLKYGNPERPTYCEHDVLYIVGIDSENVSQEDIKELDRLGFFIDQEEGGFMSYEFGSA